jgi:muramoyltetrapeptide carboxypeptidase
VGVLASVSQAVAAEAAPATWVKPPPLRPGDTIALVAPAGPADRGKIEPFVERCRQAGFRVRVPDDLYRRTGYLAGTDEQRVRELNRAIRDPRVTAIFPCRGGYGLTRILDRVDYAALRRHPKLLIGYSDVTALHLAIARHARLVTFHSPMPQSDLWRDDGAYASSSELFWAMLTARRGGWDARLRREIPQPPRADRPVTLVGGRARGRLAGGNLTLVCATLGTPFALEAKGRILFLEDTGEAPYRVDRMLSQLRLAGVFDQIAGLIVGTFNETDERAVDSIVRGYCGRLDIPVITGFPIGHTAFNATLPCGVLAELDADHARVRLLESPWRTE